MQDINFYKNIFYENIVRYTTFGQLNLVFESLLYFDAKITIEKDTLAGNSTVQCSHPMSA